jgi:hypothetical protein
MALPTPESGLVISYRYLWRYEHEKGMEEGRKNRPCVIVLAVEQAEGGTLVTVAPTTHSPPAIPTDAVEIPLRVKQHLGLDDLPSWVIVREVNQFIWPGFDLVPVFGKPEKYDYGFVSPALFERIKKAIIDNFASKQGSITLRD